MISDSPVRVEIYFDPEKYKIDPERCIEYKFIFDGSTEIKSMHTVDIEILETLYQCTYNVGKVIQDYITSYHTYKEKITKEIDGLMGRNDNDRAL